jgi:hypothetical protein
MATPSVGAASAPQAPASYQGARFQAIRTLGKGAYGFVQLAIDHHAKGTDQQQVAIKYIPR